VSSTAHGSFVGVDGGGTHTIALVGSSSAKILGRGVAGPSNPQAVGFEAAVEQIEAAVRAALAGPQPQPFSISTEMEKGDGTPRSVPLAISDEGSPWRRGSEGRDRSGVRQITLGIAGCGRPSDRQRLAAMVSERLGLAPAAVRVVTDVALLLPAANLGSGIALVAGTGSSAFGVAPSGRTANAGGWGYLLGDDGSAFEVGRHALRAILRADDGLGPPTQLTAAVKQALGVSQPRDLIRSVYQSSSPRTTIAELAPLVVSVARDGDGIARQIVARAGEILGQLACAVARRLALGSDATVIGTGGLFQAGDLVVAPLRRSLDRVGLDDFRLLDAEPAIGALRLATGEVRLESNG
jgi:N-acetylmuramic acid 6-phosphate etherase